MLTAQVLVVADTPDRSAVIQAGQPPAQMGAWLLDIPEGSDARATAAAWVEAQTLPLGTIVRIVDISVDPPRLYQHRLSAAWEDI